MKQIILSISILLLLTISMVSADPAFVIRRGVNDSMVLNALNQVNLTDYDSVINFNNEDVYNETNVFGGYFRYMYYYNDQISYSSRYHIDIYNYAYTDEETLVCVLKHELMHYDEFKKSKLKLRGLILSEEYADTEGCKLK